MDFVGSMLSVLDRMLAGIYQESNVQDDKHQVDDGAAQENRVKAAENHMINEDHSEQRFPIDAQLDNG